MKKIIQFSICLLAIIICSGCVSTYVYQKYEFTTENSKLKSLTVGVKRNPDNFDYKSTYAPLPPLDIDTLVSSLKARDIFKDIFIIENESRAVDLILSTYLHREPGVYPFGGVLCIPMIAQAMTVVTLSIIPVYCSLEYDVSFTLEGNTDKKRFIIKRDKKGIVGVWAPLFPLVNSNWEHDNPKNKKHNETTERRFIKNYYDYFATTLLKFEDEIIQLK